MQLAAFLVAAIAFATGSAPFLFVGPVQGPDLLTSFTDDLMCAVSLPTSTAARGARTASSKEIKSLTPRYVRLYRPMRPLPVAHTSGSQNNQATEDACTRYRNRNTGNEQWDTCPDCSTVSPELQVPPGPTPRAAGLHGALADFATQSFRGDLKVCNSPAEHIGGDEWEYYCRQSGADIGKAD